MPDFIPEIVTMEEETEEDKKLKVKGAGSVRIKEMQRSLR